VAAHLFRAGWLGSPARDARGTKRGFQDRAELIKVKLANMRVRMGVAAPYGARAEQLNLGTRTPPSRRRGAPHRGRPRSTSRSDRDEHLLDDELTAPLAAQATAPRRPLSFSRAPAPTAPVWSIEPARVTC